MKISTSIICMLAMSSIVLADGAFVTKIVRVRGNARELSNLGCVATMSCNPSEPLRAVVLNGTEAKVAQAEQNIKELDALAATVDPVAKKNIETTVYVISGSAEAMEGVQEVSGEALTPVLRQLRAIFPYSHYQLLGSMMLRSAEDTGGSSAGLMNTMSWPGFNHPLSYTITYKQVKGISDPSGYIHLFDFRFTAAIPNVSRPRGKDANVQISGFSTSDVRIGADLDVREGQKVVVGKANVSDSDTCFFIVVSARLVP